MDLSAFDILSEYVLSGLWEVAIPRAQYAVFHDAVVEELGDRLAMIIRGDEDQPDVLTSLQRLTRASGAAYAIGPRFFGGRNVWWSWAEYAYMLRDALAAYNLIAVGDKITFFKIVMFVQALRPQLSVPVVYVRLRQRMFAYNFVRFILDDVAPQDVFAEDEEADGPVEEVDEPQEADGPVEEVDEPQEADGPVEEVDEPQEADGPVEEVDEPQEADGPVEEVDEPQEADGPVEEVDEPQEAEGPVEEVDEPQEAEGPVEEVDEPQEAEGPVEEVDEDGDVVMEVVVASESRGSKRLGYAVSYEEEAKRAKRAKEDHGLRDTAARREWLRKLKKADDAKRKGDGEAEGLSKVTRKKSRR